MMTHRTACVCLLVSSLAPLSGSAETWESSPSSGEWGDANNWSSGSVPGSSSIATFATSSVTDISISTAQGPTSYSVGFFAFGPGADAFTFTFDSGIDFTIHEGVANESGQDQLFYVEGNLTITSGTDFDKKTIFETKDSGTLAIDSGATVTHIEVVNNANVDLNGGGSFSLGSLSGTGALISYDDTALTVGSLDKDDTYAGSLASDSGTTLSLTKTGSGTWTLSGDNSYTGGTTLAKGTLVIGSDTATGTGDITITGGTLEYADGVTQSNDVILQTDGTLEVSSGTATQAGVIAESGGTYGITKTGGGTLILDGENTYSGGTTISEGTLQMGDNGSVTGEIVNDATLAFDTSGTIVFSNAVSGSGSLVKAGSGIVVLIGDNTYSGGTTISDGTLYLGFENTSGSITGDVVNDGTLIFNRTDDIVFDGVISGTGDVKKESAGTLELTAASTFSGDMVIDKGQVIVSDTAGNALQNSTVYLNVDNGIGFGVDDITVGALNGSGDISATSSVSLTAGGNGDNATYSGNFTGDINVVDVSTGSWTLTGTGHDFTQMSPEGNVIFDGAAGTVGSFVGDSGQVTFQNGTVLAITGSYAGADLTVTGSGTAITVGDFLQNFGNLLVEDGASLSAAKFGFDETSIIVDGATLTVGSIHTTSSSVTVQISNPDSGSALVFDLADDATLDNPIADYTSGPGGITKEGDGTLTMTSTSTFTGDTIINGGKILDTSTERSALQYSTVYVNVDQGLDLSDEGYMLGGLAGSGDLTASTTAVIITGNNNGDATYSGTLTGDDFTVDMEGTGTWTLTGTGHDFYQLYANEGTTVFDGATGTIDLIEGADGEVIFTNGADFTLTEGINVDSIVVENGANVDAGTGFVAYDSIIIDQATVTTELFGVSASTGTVQISDPDGGTALILNVTNDTSIGDIADYTSGPGSILKTGSGTLTADGDSSYSGGTTIEEGTVLLASNTGLGTGTILLNGGTLYVAGATVSNAIAFGTEGGTITGAAIIDSAVALTDVNQVLTSDIPGGIEFLTDQSWESFTYDWKIADWTDTAGLGEESSFILIEGALTLTGTEAGSYVLDITSLSAVDPIEGDTIGDVPNFTEEDLSWEILTTTDGIFGFDIANWIIDTSNFSSDPAYVGTFSLTQDGNSLLLTYTVPEPAAGSILLGTFAAGLLYRRRSFPIA